VEREELGRNNINARNRRHLKRGMVRAPVATQEAEIKRISIQSQPRQIVHETLLKNPSQK
jgi:hypothetical protein